MARRTLLLALAALGGGVGIFALARKHGQAAAAPSAPPLSWVSTGSNGADNGPGTTTGYVTDANGQPMLGGTYL